MEINWLRGNLIGRGSFGSVNLATRMDSKHRAAVKSCLLSNSSSLLHEKKILTLLGDSLNIIPYLGDSLSHDDDGATLYNVFLEYAPGGSLADRVRSLGSGLPEHEVKRHAMSILKALSHIHLKGLVHCDVKLQNVLLCVSESGNEVAKLCDFGLSKFSGERAEGFEIRGTPISMSPESVNSGEYEPPSDVWGLGCAVSEMFSGEPVWRCTLGYDMASLLFRIGSGEESPRIPSAFSEDGKDFLRRCFVRDPRERWTAEMLLGHPFVNVEDGRESKGEGMSSPIGIFDFPARRSMCGSIRGSLPESEWNSSPPAGVRMRLLWTQEGPDWTFSKSWVNVRS